MLVIRQLGLLPLPPVYQAMRGFTEQRGLDTPDELWLLEHAPVYTQGLNGKPEHLLTPSEIPVVAVDRGGQITYHGPGQLVLYCLLDLKRAGVGFGVRKLVCALEQAVIALLAEHRIDARGRRDAPGVYVGARKLASLGLRVRRGCSYHGLSLNVNMDLTPFASINPCGYRGLRMTQLSDLGLDWSVEQTGVALSQRLQQSLINHLGERLRYTTVEHTNRLPLSHTQEITHAAAAR